MNESEEKGVCKDHNLWNRVDEKKNRINLSDRFPKNIAHIFLGFHTEWITNKTVLLSLHCLSVCQRAVSLEL